MTATSPFYLWLQAVIIPKGIGSMNSVTMTEFRFRVILTCIQKKKKKKKNAGAIAKTEAGNEFETFFFFIVFWNIKSVGR